MRLSFGTGANLRASMTESFGDLDFKLPGRLTVQGVAFDLHSDVAFATVRFRRRDDEAVSGDQERQDRGRAAGEACRREVGEVRHGEQLQVAGLPRDLPGE